MSRLPGRRADEAPLLAASPDHYVLARSADGIQQVIETTGGSPLASRIFLDESDRGPLDTPADPSFPVQWVAIGRPRLGGPPPARSATSSATSPAASARG